MPVMTRNIVDLKYDILTKVDEKFNHFDIEVWAETRDQIKKEVSILIKAIYTFVMPVMTRKNMVDLKYEILTKIDEKFNHSDVEIWPETRDQIKKEVSEALQK